jgi:TolB-like protein/Tfp pilus assembly protein PilF
MTSPSLWSRLKNAHLFRVLVIYLAVAWVVLQIVGLFIETMDLPRWTMPWTLVFLFVGLVVVMATGWIQSHPLMPQREAADEVPGDWEVDLGEIKESISKGRLPHLNWARAIMGGVVALVLLFGFAGLYVVIKDGGGSPDSPPPLPGDAASATAVEAGLNIESRSIAVLPFTDLSPERDEEYFSDGITEEIIAQLSRLRDLKVISRTSVMIYRETDMSLRQIGQELGVATILEGSVRHAAGRVRITAQLIDARTDQHLWSEIYERELEDIFAIQTDVAERIAGALRTELTADELARLQTIPTSDLEAYQLYLKGRFYWNMRTEEGLTTAKELFEQAIGRDPAFALAYAALASTYVVLPWYTTTTTAEIVAKVETAAQRAIALDDELSEAHVALAAIRGYEWLWEESVREYRRGLELSPGSATAHHWYAINQSMIGNHEYAIALIEEARELDPLSLIINTEVGWIYYLAGQFDRAIEEYRRAIEMDPRFPQAHEYLWGVYERTGEYAAAIAAAEETLRLQGYPPSTVSKVIGDLQQGFEASGGEGYWNARVRNIENLRVGSTYQTSPLYLATLYAAVGDADRAFDLLEEGYFEGDYAVGMLNAEPGVALLRDDRRFSDLLARVGLQSAPTP